MPLFLVVLLLLARLALAGAADWKFREVPVQVLGVDQRPVTGVEVSLYGLERDALSFLYGTTGTEDFDGWRFETDADGRFTAKFGEFRQRDYIDATGQVRPGWGTFYFVVQPGDVHAGGVSRRILNYEKPDYRHAGREDEWVDGVRTPLTLANGPQQAIFSLQRGGSVSGRVQLTDGSPVPKAHVAVRHDLHAWSRTGVGAEIFEQATATDARGNFVFRNVYPNRCDIILKSPGHYWVRTRVGFRWANEIENELQVEAGTETRITIVVSTQKPHRYFGRVTDSAGRPVADAKITAGISNHRKPRTYSDWHAYVSTQSGQDGGWELLVVTPFIRGFSVTASGYARFDAWQDEKMFAPGDYDFKLTAGNGQEPRAGE